MDVKNLGLTIENFTKGGRAIVASVAPDYEYKDGVRDTSKPIGQRVTVVFPSNGYETQTVKVANPVDTLSVLMDKVTDDKPLCVKFVDFTASIYSMKGTDGRWRTGVSARAADVKPVMDDDFEIVLT